MSQETNPDLPPQMPWGRVGLNFLALVVAAVTMAPLGIVYLTSSELAGAMKRSDALRAGTQLAFWVVAVGVGIFASCTRRKNLGGALTAVLLAVALVNVGGCASILTGIGRATGG